MVRWAFGALLVVAVSAVNGYGQEKELEARVDSVFAEYDNTRSPGCALGVIRDGKFVLKRGYGMANLEHGIPNSPTTVFRIGSTSKQFTAAALVLLAADGKLSLDDDIRRFLPEMRDYGTPVTIRHLLHHTSGVRDYLMLMTLRGKRGYDWYTDDEVVSIVARQRELNFEPGEQFLYSNSGYFLLSQIVKRASGMSLREYAADRIFGPLGMEHTHFHDDHAEIVPNRASGYAQAEDGGFRISMTTLDMVGDGGVFTTVEDLYHWDQNFYRPRVGGQSFLDQLLTRGVLSNGDTLDYALGLGHAVYRGLDVVRHGGAFVGFRADMMRCPSERFTVICLCNLSTASPSRLAERVTDIFLEDRLAPVEEEPEEVREEPEEEQPLELSAEQLAVYAGDYYSEELDVTYRLRLEGDTLRLFVGNWLDSPLTPSEPDVFRARVLTFRFTREPPERASGFLLDAGRVRNLRFERVKD
ncbi:MAG: beta-lactamase family protein [Gemmatimonadota bacterium]|nr:MAG: beta-lactamase family protein [Gemmatimonadota bacterium]